MQRLRPADVAGARRDDTDVGGSAVGRVPGHAGVSAAPARLSTVRDPDRAARVRRWPRPDDPPPGPADWAGLSVDADQSRGRAARRELEQGAPGRAGVARGLGRRATEAAPAPPRRR